MTWTWRIPWTPIHMSKLLRNTDIWAIKKIIIKKNTTKRTLISQYNCHCSFPSCKLIPSPTPLLICHSIFNWCWQQAIQISVHCTAGSDWSSEMHLTLAWTTKINTKQHAMISKREGTRFKTKKKKKEECFEFSPALQTGLNITNKTAKGSPNLYNCTKWAYHQARCKTDSQIRLAKKAASILFYLTTIRQLSEQKSALSFVNRIQCNMSTVIPRNPNQFTSNLILHKDRKSCSDLQGFLLLFLKRRNTAA